MPPESTAKLRALLCHREISRSKYAAQRMPTAGSKVLRAACALHAGDSIVLLLPRKKRLSALSAFSGFGRSGCLRVRLPGLPVKLAWQCTSACSLQSELHQHWGCGTQCVLAVEEQLGSIAPYDLHFFQFFLHPTPRRSGKASPETQPAGDKQRMRGPRSRLGEQFRACGRDRSIE